MGRRLETGILTLHPKTDAVMPMLYRLKEQYIGKAGEKGLTFAVTSAGENMDIQAVFDEKWTLEALGTLLTMPSNIPFRAVLSSK